MASFTFNPIWPGELHDLKERKADSGGTDRTDSRSRYLEALLCPLTATFVVPASPGKSSRCDQPAAFGPNSSFYGALPRCIAYGPRRWVREGGPAIEQLRTQRPG